MTASGIVLDGVARLLGYKLVTWRHGEALISYRTAKEHLNRSGYLHGGIYTILLDAACGYSGSFVETGEPPLLALTLQFTTQYHAAALEGDTLMVTGRIATEGRTIFHTVGEARREDGRLLASGVGVYRRRGRHPANTRDPAGHGTP